MKLTVRFFSLLSVSVLFASCCQTRTSDVPVYLDDNQPLFAFGHGLSYTEFTYGEAKVSKDVVKAGKEVVQLYIGDEESSLERPVKELKGFSKIALEPGETKTVTFNVDPEKLMYFDDAKHEWVLEKGVFTAYVGSASDDIRTQISFEIK